MGQNAVEEINKETKKSKRTVLDQITFENYSYYHHPFDEFSRMDIPHMTAFIQEFLPAVTKITTSPTQEITMNK